MVRRLLQQQPIAQASPCTFAPDTTSARSQGQPWTQLDNMASESKMPLQLSVLLPYRHMMHNEASERRL
jgi:hypothetical protein